MTDSEYTGLTVTQMVNVWLPLNKNPTRNTLAILDPSTMNEKLMPYTAVRKDKTLFTAKTVMFEESQQWIASNIRRGDAIIFDSMKVPHSAINLP